MDKLSAQIQKTSDDHYKGVECEIVTEPGKGHILKMYVDGNYVEGGQHGLVAAMQNRLGT